MMTPSIDTQGFKKPPPPSQYRAQPASHLAYASPRYPDLENDFSYYPDRQPIHSTPSKQRESNPPRKGLFLRPSPDRTLYSQDSSSRLMTPAMSLRGGTEPHRYQTPDFRFDSYRNPSRILARGTIDNQEDLYSSPQKRSYEEAEAYQESCTQPETSTHNQWPLHPMSSPRAHSARQYPDESPSAKRSKRFQTEETPDPFDRPLIDLDAPTIRMNRRTPLPDPEDTQLAMSFPANQLGKIPINTVDPEAIVTEIRSKSGLYSLAAEDLENVVASVVCEEGFAALVSRFLGTSSRPMTYFGKGDAAGQEYAEPLASPNQGWD